MKKTLVLSFLVAFCSAFTVVKYPIDGYEKTGIKRLKRLELIKSGEIKDASALPAGALKSYSESSLTFFQGQQTAQPP